MTTTYTDELHQELRDERDALREILRTLSNEPLTEGIASAISRLRLRLNILCCLLGR